MPVETFPESYFVMVFNPENPVIGLGRAGLAIPMETGKKRVAA